MFKIIKKGANNFWHVFNNNAKEVAISDFEVVLDAVANTFVIVFKNGANLPNIAVGVLNIIVIDETDSSTEYTFTNVADLRDKLVILGYTAYLCAGNADSITGLVIAGTNVTITGSGTLADPYVINSSGGGGAVDSVNGQTGTVVLDADDISQTASRVFVTPTEKTATTHSNRDILDLITEAFTTALKTAYNTAKSNIDDLLLTGSRLITTAEITKLSNTSGTNSGDNATNSLYSGLATSKQDVLTDVNFGSFSNGLTAKTTPLNSDTLNISDTADSNKSKKVTWTNIKAFLKTYFDSLYLPTTSWIDYSATSTIVGWSSFTTKDIQIIPITNNVGLCTYEISGVSNSATKSFTLDRNVLQKVLQTDVTIVNNSGNLTSGGRMLLNSGSSVCDFKINALGTSFTSSNTASVLGQFYFKY